MPTKRWRNANRAVAPACCEAPPQSPVPLVMAPAGLWANTARNAEVSNSKLSRSTLRAISVTAAAGCGWEAVSRSGWLTITANADGMGSGVVSYAVAANQSSAARKGKVSIAGQTFAIKQKAN